MTRAYLPPRDCGPEFVRRFAREMHRIGREATRHDRAERIQAECDRLLKLTDEEAGNVECSFQ